MKWKDWSTPLPPSIGAPLVKSWPRRPPERDQDEGHSMASGAFPPDPGQAPLSGALASPTSGLCYGADAFSSQASGPLFYTGVFGPTASGPLYGTDAPTRHAPPSLPHGSLGDPAPPFTRPSRRPSARVSRPLASGPICDADAFRPCASGSNYCTDASKPHASGSNYDTDASRPSAPRAQPSLPQGSPNYAAPHFMRPYRRPSPHASGLPSDANGSALHLMEPSRRPRPCASGQPSDSDARSHRASGPKYDTDASGLSASGSKYDTDASGLSATGSNYDTGTPRPSATGLHPYADVSRAMAPLLTSGPVYGADRIPVITSGPLYGTDAIPATAPGTSNRPDAPKLGRSNLSPFRSEAHPREPQPRVPGLPIKVDASSPQASGLEYGTDAFGHRASGPNYGTDASRTSASGPIYGTDATMPPTSSSKYGSLQLTPPPEAMASPHLAEDDPMSHSSQIRQAVPEPRAMDTWQRPSEPSLAQPSTLLGRPDQDLDPSASGPDYGTDAFSHLASGPNYGPDRSSPIRPAPFITRTDTPSATPPRSSWGPFSLAPSSSPLNMGAQTSTHPDPSVADPTLLRTEAGSYHLTQTAIQTPQEFPFDPGVLTSEPGRHPSERDSSRPAQIIARAAQTRARPPQIPARTPPPVCRRRFAQLPSFLAR